MQIHGLNKTTLLDYPGRVACTIFTGGCNFRCPYCHNSELVLNPSSQPLISEEEIFAFLKKRQGILEGVCITGGEPTVNPDLLDFMKKVKELGYPIKLDSNGYRPEVLREAISEGLADCIAMDVKSGPTNYHVAAGLKTIDTGKLSESIDIIMNSGVDYEFRTTVVKGIHTDFDFEEIGNWIKGANKYFIQNYRDNEFVMVKGYEGFSDEELDHILSTVKKYIPNARIRGEE